MLSDEIKDISIRGRSMMQWRKGDIITLSFRGQTYEGLVTQAGIAGYSVKVDMRPHVLGMPVEVDPNMPESEIRLRYE